MKKVFSKSESQKIIDLQTGEVFQEEINTITMVVSNVTTRYYASMIKDDEIWYKDLNACEFKVCHYLFDNLRFGSTEFYINKTMRTKIAKVFDVSESQIQKAVKSLTDKNILGRVDRGVYMVNPAIAYKGNLKQQDQHIKLFEEAKAKYNVSRTPALV